MLFHQRHFNALAAVLANNKPPNEVGLHEWHNLVLKLGSMLEQDNPKFDAPKWLKACKAEVK